MVNARPYVSNREKAVKIVMSCYRQHCTRYCNDGGRQAEGKSLNGGWLFPGQNPINPISARQLSLVFKGVAGVWAWNTHGVA
jgi:hypothetical protein